MKKTLAFLLITSFMLPACASSSSRLPPTEEPYYATRTAFRATMTQHSIDWERERPARETNDLFTIWRATNEATHGTWEPVKCDPSYPDLCINISYRHDNVDLDCWEVLGDYDDSFRVRGDDFHNFDADGDGIGCEEYPLIKEGDCIGLEC